MSGQDIQDRTVPRNKSKDSPDVRSEFFKAYKREADEHDRVFLTKYSDDLNNTMIFAGLLSAVSTTFITNVQPNLQPDSSAATAALLKLLIHTIDNTTFQGIDLTPPVWNGPDPTIVAVQILLYLSLGASLLAALVAMLGKQWVNRYVERKRGSLIEECHDRQQKLDGINDWKFHAIMASLPLMLQLAVLLLGISLSRFMWGICSAIAVVITGVTSFGILFYAFTFISATLFYYCPFQTPLSVLLRNLTNSINNSPLWLDSRASSYFKSISHSVFIYMIKSKLRLVKLFARSSVSDSTLKTDTDRIFEDEDFDFASNKLDAHCTMWLRDASTDPEVVTPALHLISEIQWDVDIHAIPSLPFLTKALQEYGKLVRSNPTIIAGTQDKAYATAKAFLKLYILDREISIEDFDSLPAGQFSSATDLQSTFVLINRIVVDRTPQSLQWWIVRDADLSVPHISWLSHTLLDYMSTQNENDTLDIVDLNSVLQHFWSQSASLPLSVIANCILICGITLGLQIDMRDLQIIDKGPKITIIINKLYDRIKVAFQEKAPEKQAKQALTVLQFLTLWKVLEDAAYIEADTSTDLCQAIVDSAVNDGLKWDAARLVMQIGFRHRPVNAVVHFAKSPHRVCVAFLEHHFTNDPHHHDSIADAFLAMISYHRYYFDFSDSDALNERNFVRGILSALKDPSRARLHRTALHFVRDLAHRIGDSGNVFAQTVLIDHDFSAALKAGWVDDSADSLRPYIQTYLSILKGLSMSPIWHPYLLRDHWHAVEYATKNDRDWLGRLLRGKYARGSWAHVESIRISWKLCLRPTKNFKFDPELVLSTLNLLVMKQDLILDAVEVAKDAIRVVQENQEDMYEKLSVLQVTVLKELGKFLEDVGRHAPNGWGDVMVSNAMRRKKAVKKMRRDKNKLHYLNVNDLTYPQGE